MKKKGKTALSARLTALCMAVLMAFSLLPSTASAAEDTSFGRITEEAEFTTGSYVMVTDTGFRGAGGRDGLGDRRVGRHCHHQGYGRTVPCAEGRK